MIDIRKGITIMKQYLNVSYKKTETHELCADFYIPEEPENPPIIMWIHGGGWKDLNIFR